MPRLTLSSISKSFGDRRLFADVAFTLSERERLALIGANGTGKTTLLRIIAALTEADTGSVNREPGTTVGYLPQEVDLPGESSLQLAVAGVTGEVLTCATELHELERRMRESTGEQAGELGARYAEVSHRFDTLGGFDYETQARGILLGLGFDESDLAKPVQVLSGGQKTRAALARLLMLAPDLLLLDEPTNHLDIPACEWLQEFLQTRYAGAAIIVSHDRYFLDRVVGGVMELDGSTLVSYRGNYTDYARRRAERIEESRKLFKEQQKEIVRLEAAIQTLFSHRKFSRRDSKIKQLERISRVEIPKEKRSISVSLSASVRSGREVVRLSKIAKSYPGKVVFDDVDLVVERGQKIGIVGPNGSGKTTLLKIIADRETSDSGDVLIGHNVRPVYFAQEFDHLAPERTVLEELLANADISSKDARDLLARFLFLGDDAFKKVEVLSGGEQCRLALAKVLADRPNLLLLDEPTNHLDIASREALEDAMRGFDGTILVASHDRYLLDAVSTGILEVRDGSASAFLGNYTAWLEKASPNAPSDGANAPAPPAALRQRPMTALREKEKLLRDLARRQRELEKQIERLEARAAELTTLLGDEETYRSGAARDYAQEYAQIEGRLSESLAAWEETSHAIEQEQDTGPA